MDPDQYVDSHAHLYFEKFAGDRAEVIARARDAGFVGVVNVAIDVPTTKEAIALAQEYPGFCHASAGLHPTETNLARDTLASVIGELEALIDGSPICAVGEIGLDYYWDKSPADAQDRAFRMQLELAEAKGLPVIIHCREAMEETLRVVADYAGRVRGVFHCFSGDATAARRVVELGYRISFCGNVTYPKAASLREAAAAVGPEDLLLETDAPFLAPQPVRGKRNEPVHALHTLAALAKLLGMDTRALAGITTRNARELFQIGL